MIFFYIFTVNIFLTKILLLDVFTQKRVNKEDGKLKNQHEADDHIFLLPAKTKPSVLFSLDICYVNFFWYLRIYLIILVGYNVSGLQLFIWFKERNKKKIKIILILLTLRMKFDMQNIRMIWYLIRFISKWLNDMIFNKTSPIKISSCLSNFQFT